MMRLLQQQTEYISCHHLQIVSSMHLINVKIFQSPEIVQSQSRKHLDFHKSATGLFIYSFSDRL
jgi:hypothetical protein